MPVPGSYARGRRAADRQREAAAASIISESDLHARLLAAAEAQGRPSPTGRVGDQLPDKPALVAVLNTVDSHLAKTFGLKVDLSTLSDSRARALAKDTHGGLSTWAFGRVIRAVGRAAPTTAGGNLNKALAAPAPALLTPLSRRTVDKRVMALAPDLALLTHKVNPPLISGDSVENFMAGLQASIQDIDHVRVPLTMASRQTYEKLQTQTWGDLSTWAFNQQGK